MQAASRFLREWAPRSETVVLAPTHTAADELARVACAHGAAAGIHRFALREFVIAAGSALLNEREITPLRQVGREALVARVTALALERGLLSQLRSIAQFPGFPRALARTLERIRINRVPVESLGRVHGDLAVLLKLYESELAERSLADHASRVALALEAMRTGRCRFSGLPVVALDVEPQGALDADLLEQLCAAAPGALRCSLAGEPGEGATGLESLQRNLFSGQRIRQRSDDGTFALFSASGESLECVEIARRLLEAARRGVRFDHCAILLRDPVRYQPLVWDALDRAGIPAFFSRGSRRPRPSGRAFLALLRCAAEGCSASAFAEYLSLGQMPSEEEQRRTPIAWERLLMDAGVIGGIERWRRRIDGLVEEYLLRMEQCETLSEKERYARQVDRLESLANFALPILRRLDELPASAHWSVWIDALWDLAEVSLEDPSDVHELLEELLPMADAGPVDLASVVLVLHPLLVELHDRSGDERYGKVFVGSVEDARGMSFAHVFLPGLNEGVFPRLNTEDPLLPDEQCVRLGIRAREDDAHLPRVAVACASERVVISWSRLDLLTGRPRVPSFYAFEALRTARGGTVDVRALEQEAREATETRIGWPAPKSPGAAIDDLEFDLSYLRPAWEKRIQGAAAYLKRVNEHAVRSLRARWRRWENKWRLDDGLVDLDIHALQVLEAHRPSRRGWSVSALQQFARCPYRFALKGIYGLEPQERPAPVQTLDPATRGAIFHQVQFRLLRLLREAGALPVTRENLSSALEHLAAVVHGVAAEYADRLCPAIPQVWESEIDRLHADLRGWLHFKAYDTGWTPELFELSFGLQDAAQAHDPASLPEAVRALPGLLLRGSIDLIERRTDGVRRVVDHKTGRAPQQRIVAAGGGEQLQPLLYALAAEAAIEGPVAGGQLFYATLRGNYATMDVPLTDGARRCAERVIAIIDQSLSKGFLPAAPRKDGCKNCEYLPICGPWEEDRIARKPKAELRPLEELRRME